MKADPFAAKILEACASAYAGFAASLLLERRPEIGERLAPAAMAHWKAHLAQRVLELSAAVAAGQAELFVSRVEWDRRGFRARQVPEEDLRAAVQALREVLQEELPENARGGAAACLDRALAGFEMPLAEEPGLDPAEPRQRLALEYLKAVLEGEGRQAVERVRSAVEEGLAVRDAYLEVLLPAQREVGRLWHGGELSVSEEHVVTATTQRVMAMLAGLRQPRPANRKTMIAAAVAGNSHDLGVRVLADFFEFEGWNAVCLGADVPAAELASAVRFFAADLLVLSAALAPHLARAREAVEAVRKLGDHPVKVLVGGVAFAAAPELWRNLGADGYAPDAEQALALGARLVGLDS